MAPRRARQALSEFDKIWLAKCRKKKGYSFQQCREAFWKEFNRDPEQWPLPNSSLSGFLNGKQIDEWAAKDLMASSETSFRQREAQYPKLEEALYLWVIQTTEGRSGTVSDAVAKKKAEDLGPKLGITGFRYSPGWLSNWKKRYHVKSHRLHGEARSADLEGVQKARCDLRKLLAPYAACDRYNYDESGLFYKLQPNKTIARTTLAGRKVLKDRITVGLACNSDGTEMLKPVIVHKSLAPRAFKQKKFKPEDLCYWFSNKSAWVTAGVFKEMMRKWNRLFEVRGRKVIMLMDNAPVHIGFEVTQQEGFDVIETSHMLVVFLPANTTSHVRPLDQGIINSWKFKYRAQLVAWLIRMYDSLPADQDVSKVVPDMVQVVQWVCSSWKEVTAECVQNCWRHSSITEAPAPVPRQQRHTKAAKRRQGLVSFVTECTDLEEAEAAGQLSGSECADAGSSSDCDAKQTEGTLANDASATSDTTNELQTAPAHSEMNFFAEDVLLFDDALKQLLEKLTPSQRALYQPMTACELLEMQNEEEAIDTAEKLTDQEICELVMSENVAIEAAATDELQADEYHASKAPVLTTLADAQAHINDLIEFFESGHEGLSADESLQHSKQLNDMLTSLTHARQVALKQSSVQSFFQRMNESL
jgi:hypothetical protein